ncbi:MAG: hypothetical protein JXA20_11325 [Spirochaetes bacterium]|nr:hypothetical protein [Spirochaetota bacterium]
MKPSLLSLVVAVLMLSCADPGGGATAVAAASSSRGYYMGLTPFPYDISTVAAVEYVYEKIGADADLMAHHFDNGVPWDEALADGTFPAGVMDDWSFRRSRVPSGHMLYVAVTPISSMRDGLAPLWNESGDNQPLDGTVWEGRTFNHADVKSAYRNYCRRVIDYFSPDYVAVGVEVNLVKEKIPAQWGAYLELQQYLYADLKVRYPDLPVFVTLTAIDLVEGYSNADHAGQMEALAQIMDYTDYYAISLHPFFAEVPGGSLPADMFQRIFSLSDKPACITETSYPAETLTMTDYDPDVTIVGSDEAQREYVAMLLDEAERHNLLFVVNFLVRDYDVLWSDTLGAPENLLKAWRDTGFYDQDGRARPALDLWRSRLALPRR